MNRTIGSIIVFAGLGIVVGAWSMSVQMPAEPGIANNDLMALRAMAFQGGCLLTLIGVIVLATAKIVAELRTRP